MTKTCKFLCLMTVVLSVTNANALTFKSGEKNPLAIVMTHQIAITKQKMTFQPMVNGWIKIRKNHFQKSHETILNNNSTSIQEMWIETISYPSQKKKIVKPQSSCSNMNTRVTTKIGGVGESRDLPNVSRSYLRESTMQNMVRNFGIHFRIFQKITVSLLARATNCQFSI